MTLTAFLTLSPAHADDAELNLASARLAADWINSQWEDDKINGAAGSADAIIALAAVDLHHETIDGLLGALAETADAYATQPDYMAKVLIAADAGGHPDPAHLLGADRDLVAELLEMLENNQSLGSFGPYLVPIALLRLDTDIPTDLMDHLFDNMLQGSTGGFGWSTSSQDPDFTAVAIMALNLIAERSGDAEVREEAEQRRDLAIAWSQDPSNQRIDADGNNYWTNSSPANSTGMLGAALAEAGIDISGPQAYLRGRQAATTSGAAWSNTATGTTDNLMATLQAVLAIAGKGYGHAQRTVEVTPEPNPTVTVTETAQPTATPTITVTETAEPTATPTITVTETAQPTATPTVTITAEPTATPTVTVTAESSTTPTVTVTAEPSATPTVTVTQTVEPTATPTTDIYVTEGEWTVNGREWRTTCEPYSSDVDRCRTEIWGTQVLLVDGSFVQTTGWIFNNLTYTEAPRSSWAGNPLGNHNSPEGWVANDGRQWRTECDTETTGRNGCRSWIWATYYGDVAGPGEPTGYGQINGWVMNNMVRLR